MQVSSKLNAASWGRLRRYREFDALHRELLSLGLEPLQPMPPKGVRRNPVDLTERAAHLTQYTNALLKVPEILTSPQLADFLELEKVLGAGLLSPVPLASLGGAAFGSPLSGKSKSPSTSTDLSSSIDCSSPDLEARLLARIGAVELVGPEGRARGADLVRRGALVAALALLCGGALLLAPPQAAGAGATGGAGRAVVRKAAPTEINLSFGTTLAARSPPPARRSGRAAGEGDEGEDGDEAAAGEEEQAEQGEGQGRRRVGGAEAADEGARLARRGAGARRAHADQRRLRQRVQAAEERPVAGPPPPQQAEAQGLGVSARRRRGASAARGARRPRPRTPFPPLPIRCSRRHLHAGGASVPYRPDVSHVIPAALARWSDAARSASSATRPVAADCPLDALSLTPSRACNNPSEARYI